MTLRFGFSSEFARFVCGAAVGTWLMTPGCGENPPNQSGFTSGGFGGSSVTTESGGGAVKGGAASTTSSKPCIPAAEGHVTHSVGNYDNMSCNKADCHTGKVGGWVYASPKGYPWVEGATVTITNEDGSELTAVSGVDGFFDFGEEPEISSPYTVCVSKCPNTECNLTEHTSTDCLSSDCHALPNVRIYVRVPKTDGSGGTTSTTGENCEPPATGGPYVHLAAMYGTTSCVGDGCHGAPKPVYKGGYLFDGPTSKKTVAGATIKLIPEDGETVTAVTGPDGMFFFGTTGLKVTTKEIPTPYTACVSKCPTEEVCSNPNEHTTDDDCALCHDTYTTDRIYLR